MDPQRLTVRMPKNDLLSIKYFLKMIITDCNNLGLPLLQKVTSFHVYIRTFHLVKEQNYQQEQRNNDKNIRTNFLS